MFCIVFHHVVLLPIYTETRQFDLCKIMYAKTENHVDFSSHQFCTFILQKNL